jgi:hypothetical protein
MSLLQYQGSPRDPLIINRLRRRRKASFPSFFNLTNRTKNLARYIIRASFSQKRMKYLDDEGTVIYAAKDGSDKKVFDAEEWLAVMCSDVPNHAEQMFRYYGWYSNILRGKRQKKITDDIIPSLIESDISTKACRKSWARLIRKIYEVIPCFAQSRGTLRIISFIEAPSVMIIVVPFSSVILSSGNLPPPTVCRYRQ